RRGRHRLLPYDRRARRLSRRRLAPDSFPPPRAGEGRVGASRLHGMSFRACVLTVSTKGARGERADESGEKVSEELARVPCEIADSLEAVMEALPHGLRTLRGDVSDAPAAHRPR